MRERIILIGAGSAVFTRGLVYDLIARGRPDELVLVDIDADALAVAAALARRMIAGRGAPLRLRATVDRREALAGATVVITTIAVGGRRAWEDDVQVPRRHGVWQPVGDSVGPGGASRALRMIPAMVAIARDVVELCPQALFVNYANPMAPICRAVRRATGAELIGLCHGVHHYAARLARALGCAPAAFGYAAVGVNHLTWFTAARVDGVDAMPRLRALAAERARGGDDPFCWYLAERVGAFPSAGDRHVVEFFPWLFPEGRYRGGRLGIDAFPFEGTIADGDRGFAEMRALAGDDAPLPASFWEAWSGEHEQVVALIDDLRADRPRTYSANLPNDGQLPNAPRDAIVEAPAVVAAGALRAVAQPPLPPAMAGPVARHGAWVECVVEAALRGDRGAFVQALLADGAVTSTATAEALADDLLRAQARFLPQFAGGAATAGVA